MRYELRLHRLLLSMMVTLLVLFVIGLLYLHARPSEEHLEATVSLVIVIAVAAILGFCEGFVDRGFRGQTGRSLCGKR